MVETGETVINSVSLCGVERTAVRSQPTVLCFVEREQRLHAFRADEVDGAFRYARAFEWVVDGLSTPFDGRDRLLGSLRMGPLPPEAPADSSRWLDRVHASLLFSPGHMTLDYSTVLRCGLRGIADRAATNAGSGGEREQVFAANTQICVEALQRWIARYVAAVRMEPNAGPDAVRAADALAVAPLNPAVDFRSALQACWFVHMVMSGVVGGRDFGFGRLDQILWPYLEADLAAGTINGEEVDALLDGFYLKLNWMAGNARGYPDKVGHFQPIPSTGTKQYIVLGGQRSDGTSGVNPLSFRLLEAAARIRLREPVLHVRYNPDADSTFRRAAVSASIQTQGQVQFANERLTIDALQRRGVAFDDAVEFGASACSRLDIGGTHGNGELWTLPTVWLADALAEAGEPSTFEDLLKCFDATVRREVAGVLAGAFARREPFYDTPFVNEGGLHFHLESLFLKDCLNKSLHLCEGGGRYRLHLVCFVGLATLVNSLLAIRRIVFEEHRMGLQAFDGLVRNNWCGAEEMRDEVRMHFPKFGNDSAEADELAGRVGRILLDAVEAVETPSPREITMGCFYSLIVHLWAGQQQQATHDGRLAGEALSENQSPVYGTEKCGITGTLNSLAALPFDRAVSGSLNLLFPANVPIEKVQALIDVYFRRAGSMVGLTFADRDKLEDAMLHPDRHPFLQVRMHGFSEYFVNMPREEQEEVLARTSF